MFPYATDAGPGRSGNDILNAPGLNVEVKATGEKLSLMACLRQALAGGTPWWVSILVWRHNGQGEKGMDDWTVSMSLIDFERLWKIKAEYVKTLEEGNDASP